MGIVHTRLSTLAWVVVLEVVVVSCQLEQSVHIQDDAIRVLVVAVHFHMQVIEKHCVLRHGVVILNVVP